jgi:hypothetical protein
MLQRRLKMLISLNSTCFLLYLDKQTKLLWRPPDNSFFTAFISLLSITIQPLFYKELMTVCSLKVECVSVEVRIQYRRKQILLLHSSIYPFFSNNLQLILVGIKTYKGDNSRWNTTKHHYT